MFYKSKPGVLFPQLKSPYTFTQPDTFLIYGLHSNADAIKLFSLSLQTTFSPMFSSKAGAYCSGVPLAHPSMQVSRDLYYKTYRFADFRNKLECLSLASLSSLV